MNDQILISILTMLIGIAIGWVSLYFIGALWARLRFSRGVGEGQFSEEEAEKILESRGFKIIDKQRRQEIITYVDGKPHVGFVQADFIVSKHGKTYVAEVRGGSYAPDPTDSAVRRQLLEYDFVYNPDGILLVDMVDRRIHMIEFGLPEQRTERFALVVVGLIIISVLTGLLFLYIQLKLF
jgi:hypothetical protein